MNESVYIFSNGNVAVISDAGEQIPVGVNVILLGLVELEKAGIDLIKVREILCVMNSEINLVEIFRSDTGEIVNIGFTRQSRR